MKKLAKSLATALDVDEALHPNATQVQIISNTEAFIEGCREILEFDENLIRLRAKKYILIFMGSGLKLKCLNSQNIIVCGDIQNIEFLKA